MGGLLQKEATAEHRREGGQTRRARTAAPLGARGENEDPRDEDDDLGTIKIGC